MAYASITELFDKPRKTKDISLGKLKVKIAAIGAKEYDDLVAANPPSAKQKKDGASFNIDDFAPALLAKCMIEPTVTVEEATTLYQSDTWSAGEIGALYVACMRLCTEGIDIPTIADD